MEPGMEPGMACHKHPLMRHNHLKNVLNNEGSARIRSLPEFKKFINDQDLTRHFGAESA
jgi:hypothetical protein